MCSAPFQVSGPFLLGSAGPDGGMFTGCLHASTPFQDSRSYDPPVVAAGYGACCAGNPQAPALSAAALKETQNRVPRNTSVRFGVDKRKQPHGIAGIKPGQHSPIPLPSVGGTSGVGKPAPVMGAVAKPQGAAQEGRDSGFRAFGVEGPSWWGFAGYIGASAILACARPSHAGIEEMAERERACG